MHLCRLHDQKSFSTSGWMDPCIYSGTNTNLHSSNFRGNPNGAFTLLEHQHPIIPGVRSSSVGPMHSGNNKHLHPNTHSVIMPSKHNHHEGTAPLATLVPPSLQIMLHPDISTEHLILTFLLGFYRDSFLCRNSLSCEPQKPGEPD